MKRLLILAGLMVGLSGGAFAFPDVWLSSNTTTADSTATLCGQYAVNGTTTTLHGILHEVIVSSAIGGTGLTIYNSSWTVVGVNSVGYINGGAITAPFLYDVVFPNGMSYLKNGTGQMQIIYACY